MIVNRILDVVFRTLDAVDAARERFETVFGRKDAPLTTTWPPMPEDARADLDADTGPSSMPREPKPKAKSKSKSATTTTTAAATTTTTAATTPPGPATRGAEPASAPGATKTRKKPRASRAATKEASSASSVGRKGSVDRSGRDYDSPRARTAAAAVRARKVRIVDADDALDGKKLVARVLWAVGAADDAGIDGGLTAADVSALLSIAAGIEVFATNVGRVLRDETSSFLETTPDGRSRRYTLTVEGRARRDALFEAGG